MILEIRLKSYNLEDLKLTAQILKKYSKKPYGINKGLLVNLPTKIKKFCVIRSPHADKDSREHLEIRTFNKKYYINIDNSSELKNFLSLIIPMSVKFSIFIPRKY